MEGHDIFYYIQWAVCTIAGSVYGALLVCADKQQKKTLLKIGAAFLVGLLIGTYCVD